MPALAHRSFVPAGIGNPVDATLMRGRDRAGAFSTLRHKSAGEVTCYDGSVPVLLASRVPHAVAVNDVLDMQAMKIGTLESAFDLLDAGVLFVDADCRIIHANRAAQSMLQQCSPVQSARGELRTDQPHTTAALKEAVAAAAEAAIGPQGIGVALPQSGGGPAHIHVLPLTSPKTRGCPAPRACAALFI